MRPGGVSRREGGRGGGPAHTSAPSAWPRELLNAHKDNLGTTIKFVIFNELSNARNPNNMQILYTVLQHSSELAPKVGGCTPGVPLCSGTGGRPLVRGSGLPQVWDPTLDLAWRGVHSLVGVVPSCVGGCFGRGDSELKTLGCVLKLVPGASAGISNLPGAGLGAWRESPVSCPSWRQPGTAPLL